MMPAAAATQPPTMRAAPEKPRERDSHGLMRRRRPDRGGFRHHARKPLGPVLSLGAFIGGRLLWARATVNQCDITMIDSLSIAAGGGLEGWDQGPFDGGRLILPGGFCAARRLRCRAGGGR